MGLHPEEMNFDLTPGLDAYGHLWMAVLRQAIDDATVPAQNRDHIKERGEARVWIKSDDRNIGSCRWICRLLNIDIDELRQEFFRRMRYGIQRRQRVITSVGHTRQ